MFQVFCDEGASQPLQLDTHQKRFEAAREAARETVPEAASEAASEAVRETASEASTDDTQSSIVKSALYSDPTPDLNDSDSLSESQSSEIAKPATAARLESSHIESSPADEQATELTPVSPLESAALMSADSDSDSTVTRPSSRRSEPARLGHRSSASSPALMTLPVLLTLLTLLVLLLVGSLTQTGKVCLRSRDTCVRKHHHHHHHQQQQQQQQQRWVTTEQETVTDDRWTLLDRRREPWRPISASSVPADPRRAPIFIVPCHKR